MRCAHARQLDGGGAYVVPTSFCLDCGATLHPAPHSFVRARAPRVLSYGGGLDSFALLVRAIELGAVPDVVCFIDTGAPGDPGEWPGTYRHLDEVVRPLCERHGIEYVRIDHANYPVRAGRKDEARSLFAWWQAKGAMPMAGPRRQCTNVAKVERFERWLTDRFPGQEVEVWLGFEAGEESRAAKDPNAGRPPRKDGRKATRRNRFPLIEWGLCRCRCEALVRASGHPVPRKSACVFCPYASKGDWQTFAAELPGDFARVVEMEANRRITKNGIKLSIMGFSSKTKRGPSLPQFIAKPYKPKVKPCKVCGAANRATKATACSYLEDAS